MYEIVAQDISEEYAISLELEDKQHQADAVNRSLRELNETITQMTIEKEVMKTKAWVHDELGQALLLAKRYIQVPESVDKAQVLQAWRQSVMLLLRVPRLHMLLSVGVLALLIYAVFTLFLKVPLPAGILFS